MSAHRIVAPVRPIGTAVATKVWAGMITSSPGPMPDNTAANSSAEEQVLTDTASTEPIFSEKAFSNLSFSGPPGTPTA